MKTKKLTSLIIRSIQFIVCKTPPFIQNRYPIINTSKKFLANTLTTLHI